MNIKYPRTLHLPWSESITKGDKVMHNTSCFTGRKIIVTEKVDGENTTMTRHACYARSIDFKDHTSIHYIKAIHALIKYMIPEDYRVCGENL